jgi:hypothetical protein
VLEVNVSGVLIFKKKYVLSSMIHTLPCLTPHSFKMWPGPTNQSEIRLIQGWNQVELIKKIKEVKTWLTWQIDPVIW